MVTIESVKTTADIYCPSSGKLTSLNQDVLVNPSLINEKAEQTWIFEVICDEDPIHTISKEEYEAFLKENEH